MGGVLLAAAVSALGLALRVLANAARKAARVLITIYDVVIVVPLFVERLTRSGMAPRRTAVDADDSAHQAR